MARPRTPTNVLKLRGAGKKHPERMRERENEPEPEAGIGPAPKHMGEEERRIWDELVEAIPAGVLGCSDRVALERAVKLVYRSRFKEDEWTSSNETSLITYLSRFGMTPADRSRISVPKKKEKGGWDDL